MFSCIINIVTLCECNSYDVVGPIANIYQYDMMIGHDVQLAILFNRAYIVFFGHSRFLLRMQGNITVQFWAGLSFLIVSTVKYKTAELSKLPSLNMQKWGMLFLNILDYLEMVINSMEVAKVKMQLHGDKYFLLSYEICNFAKYIYRYVL